MGRESRRKSESAVTGKRPIWLRVPRSKKVRLGCRFFYARRLRLKLGKRLGDAPSSFFFDQSPQNLDGVRVAGT
jgi:hypothetical protein